MTMKRERLQVRLGPGLVLVLGALTFLSACGGAPGTPVSSPPQVAPATPSIQPAAPPVAQSPASSGAEIKVELEDNSFPREIRVKAGSKVVFVINNTSTNLHSFEVTDFEFYEEVKAMETGRVEWTVPDKKGEWDMGCFLTEPGGVHEGMEGTLVIE